MRKGLIRKSNITNKKEVNLELSDKGNIVLKAQQSFQKEIFMFAAQLYENARQEDRDTVLRLFNAIVHNMEDRVRAL